MEYIDINAENIAGEHICCAITEKKGENCVGSKKDWMKARFAEGLVFKRLDARGKVFIEYIPAENAWAPVEAPEYMYINCFWVSGQYKGQGHGRALLERAVEDAKNKGKTGMVAASSIKKRGFLSDPGFYRHMGFTLCDTAEPDFELLYLPFEKDAPKPRFKDNARSGTIPQQGMVLYYTNQCPFNDTYAPMLKTVAEQSGAEIELRKIESGEQARSGPCVFTTYSFFDNGKFVTNEIFSEKKFIKYIAERK